MLIPFTTFEITTGPSIDLENEAGMRPGSPFDSRMPWRDAVQAVPCRGCRLEGEAVCCALCAPMRYALSSPSRLRRPPSTPRRRWQWSSCRSAQRRATAQTEKPHDLDEKQQQQRPLKNPKAARRQDLGGAVDSRERRVMKDPETPGPGIGPGGPCLCFFYFFSTFCPPGVRVPRPHTGSSLLLHPFTLTHTGSLFLPVPLGRVTLTFGRPGRVPKLRAPCPPRTPVLFSVSSLCCFPSSRARLGRIKVIGLIGRPTSTTTTTGGSGRPLCSCWKPTSRAGGGDSRSKKRISPKPKQFN